MQVTLRANVKYQIYVEKTESGDSTIDFVCDPTPEQIGNTTANPGTGLTSSDASLIFTTSAAGLHYVKITASGGKTVLVADRSNDGLEPTVAVGGTATGTFVSPTDHVGVYVPMVSGTSYQIDVRSDGHPSIDPWIRDIYDESDRITLPAGMFETSYHGFLRPRLRPRQRGAGSSTPRPRPKTTSSCSAASADRVRGWATGT